MNKIYKILFLILNILLIICLSIDAFLVSRTLSTFCFYIFIVLIICYSVIKVIRNKNYNYNLNELIMLIFGFIFLILVGFVFVVNINLYKINGISELYKSFWHFISISYYLVFVAIPIILIDIYSLICVVKKNK